MSDFIGVLLVLAGAHGVDAARCAIWGPRTQTWQNELGVMVLDLVAVLVLMLWLVGRRRGS